MPLTRTGYTPRTAEDIKLSMLTRLKKKYSSFTQYPGNIQNALLDLAIQPILEYEDINNLIYNSFAYNDTNAVLAQQLAESLGLTKKTEYKAQVILTFTGLAGTLIPAYTKVASNDGRATFETQEATFIPSTGNISILALSETQLTFAAGTITNIQSVIDARDSNVVTCSNSAASLGWAASETDAELKARAQARLRGARKGGIEYAVQALQAIEGVQNRLVSGRATSIKINEDGKNYIVEGIEMVIGGGDINTINNVLYKSFFEFQKLIANPSDNDSKRKVETAISIYGNPCTIAFTKPKRLAIEIQVSLSLIDAFYSKDDIQTMLETPILSYINTLQVGRRVGKIALTKVIFNAFDSNGVSADNVRSLDFKYRIDDNTEWKAFDTDGSVPEISYDCYVEASKISLIM